MARREISMPSPLPRGERPEAVPSVVIVGRPNVGKSSLLNCLARKPISIVDPTAGVTRDRVSAVIEHEERIFELWDTGGIGTADDLAAEVEAQIEVALARADVILFVVDVQEGFVPIEQEIAARLRRIGRPILLVANKVEHQKHETAAAEFHALRLGEPHPISALHGFGRTELLDAILLALPPAHVAPPSPVLKLAIVGRQNVGKSTFINRLAREERVIVSELPGTTRDAVDVRFEWEGRAFVAVDTAGLKKRSASGDSAIDFYSLVRAYRAIRRCDVVFLMVDLSSEISRVDKQLASAIERASKPCVIVVNKWDLAKGKFTTEEYVRYLNDRLTGLAFAPVSFISARQGINIDDTLKLSEALVTQARTQVGTGELNAALKRATEVRAPEGKAGKHPRLFYATQIAVGPPSFLIFASYPELITEQYTRFLMNFLRRSLPYPEVPLRIVYRARTRRELDFPTAPPKTREKRRRNS